VLIATLEKRVLYMSPMYEGTVHDKRVADEEVLDFEEKALDFRGKLKQLQDLRFQGYQPEGARVVQPQKKLYGKGLTPE